MLEACFPAGTVSGAPKIRAMEIIDEVENVRRGPYAGAVGYVSFDGNLDTCITIRTCVIKDQRVYVQAGAGIVADSVPASEYQETCNKAMAIFKGGGVGGERAGLIGRWGMRNKMTCHTMRRQAENSVGKNAGWKPGNWHRPSISASWNTVSWRRPTSFSPILKS